MRIDRPLKLGELLAETGRLYSERFWTSLGLGAFVAVALGLGAATQHLAGFVAVGSLAFTGAWAVAARVAAGDGWKAAWSRVLHRTPILLGLTFVVSVPFALGSIDPLLLLIAVLWLALTGFSIPVTVLEHEPEELGGLAKFSYVIGRSIALARSHYLHVLGVAAVLVALYVLVGGVLVQALLGFSGNGRLASTLLVQLVLAPFFFLGLSVLYFEQKARAALPLGRPIP